MSPSKTDAATGQTSTHPDVPYRDTENVPPIRQPDRGQGDKAAWGIEGQPFPPPDDAALGPCRISKNRRHQPRFRIGPGHGLIAS